MLQIHMPVHVMLVLETFATKCTFHGFLSSWALVRLLIMVHAFQWVQWAILRKLVDVRAI